MPAQPPWIPEFFENALDGVSSAVTPELIQPTQIAWGKNTVNRGAKPGTRPPFRRLLTLPSGLVQGVSYFGIQGGMGVISIGGHIYRLRINQTDASFEEIRLPWFNSSIIKQVYMQQTVETLVIQDGQSNPILYNGSVAVRSDPAAFGVPRGTQMAYGNGRLWVAINGKELVAGDIRSNIIGSELSFTETNYLSGGGTFFFPRGITGLNFIATTGTSDYGALIVFGSDYADSLRADITFRDLWAQTPGFITSVLRHTGCASQWSLGQVNQDLYWRDAAGGIRSIRSSLSDESGAGNAPISREVSRLTDYDSPQLLPFCSSISFDNRLLVTSSPRLNDLGGITWESLIALDFAPVSTMRGKTAPAYDGQWEGLNFTHLFQGQFNSRSRAFAISLDDGGSNSLWEIMPDGRGAIGDESVSCTDGSGAFQASPIECTIEHGRRFFGNPSLRKRIERCDVYLSAMQGEIDLKFFWRTDNNQKWQAWDEVGVCAKDGEPEDPQEMVHVWKNLLPQQRPQIKSFTIPSNIDPITFDSLMTGFEFQIRLVWTGRCKIYKTVAYASMVDNAPFAMREELLPTCLENDVTGNEITYRVPVDACPFLVITLNPRNVNFTRAEFLTITSQPVSISVAVGSVILESRARAGNGDIIGYDEFIDPSTPPKKYRVRTNVGTAIGCFFDPPPLNVPPCSTLASSSRRLTVRGVCEFDRDTTILTEGSLQKLDTGTGVCNGEGVPDAVQCNPNPDDAFYRYHSAGYSSTITRTSTLYIGNGACDGATPIFGDWVINTGFLSSALTQEDTEDDAIHRFDLNTAWGGWSIGSDAAKWEARTTGFVFTYAAAQFRLSISGANPGATLVVDVRLERRLYNDGSFVPFGVQTYTLSADVFGNASVSDDVGNARGFETRAISAAYIAYL